MGLLRTLTCTPGRGASREAITFTSVVDFEGGVIGLFERARRPIYRFEILLEPFTKAEAESLSAFHAYHQGARPFTWNGGAWGTVEHFNLIGEGDGSRRGFLLPNRRINPTSISMRTLRSTTGATSIWIASSINGWPYALNAVAGAITFADSSNTIPLSGDDIQAIYACNYACVFEPDGLRMEEMDRGLWRTSLRLRETLMPVPDYVIPLTLPAFQKDTFQNDAFQVG